MVTPSLETVPAPDVARALAVEELARQFSQARPFRFVQIDDLIEPEFAKAIAASLPSFQQAHRWGRRFQTVNAQREVQLTDIKRFPEPVRRLTEVLQSPRFLQLLTKITGIPNLLVDHDVAQLL